MDTTGMIPQNKGKDLHKIAKSKVPDGPFYCSKKYDGHYVQIRHVPGKAVQMWTSGAKNFHLISLAKYIRETFPTTPFHIECEFNYDCIGMLGDRSKSAIMTTYRTDYKNGRERMGDQDKDIFRILDILNEDDMDFEHRMSKIVTMFYNKPWFHIPHQYTCNNIQECINLSEKWKAKGFEGAVAKTIYHVQVKKERVSRSNEIIKLKPRPTVDLLCIDMKEGTGKYEGMIGALLLEDSDGRQVWAGSGLNDDERHPSNSWVGSVVEINYERVSDVEETYIQPTIRHIREDKTVEEID